MVIRKMDKIPRTLIAPHRRGEAFARDPNMNLNAALGECFQACAARYPVSEVQPGEAYFLNDPYAGGHHLNYSSLGQAGRRGYCLVRKYLVGRLHVWGSVVCVAS